MKNDLFNYLKWRGDLDFDSSPLNPVDALIFCQLSYLDFDGIVSSSFKAQKTLSDVANEFTTNDYERRKDLGLLINPKTVTLLLECAKTNRFGKLQVSAYLNKYSQTLEEQFCAVTFSFKTACPGKKESFNFVAFRGTDDTLIGWKEDFNMAFKTNVPAQQDALKYLNTAATFFSNQELFCGGHSKGGNLAIYAAANLSKENQKILKGAFNFDGPGFLKETLTSSDFFEILKKTTSVYPQGSIVGMLFEHDTNYKVAKSDGILVMQHDPFTWGAEACDFELCDDLDKSSLFLNSTFNQWFVNLTEAQRKEFVEAFFGVLEATKSETNSQLMENWHKNGGRIIKAIAEMDSGTRQSSLDTIGKFLKLAGHNLNLLNS